jgi:hypothetical protein
MNEPTDNPDDLELRARLQWATDLIRARAQGGGAVRVTAKIGETRTKIRCAYELIGFDCSHSTLKIGEVVYVDCDKWDKFEAVERLVASGFQHQTASWELVSAKPYVPPPPPPKPPGLLSRIFKRRPKLPRAEVHNG